MRTAAILVFVAFICATQAQLIPRFSDFTKSISDRIDQSDNEVVNTLQNFGKGAQDTFDNVLRVGKTIGDRVKDGLQKFQANIQKQADKLLKQVENLGFDISGLKTLIQLITKFVSNIGALVYTVLPALTIPIWKWLPTILADLANLVIQDLKAYSIIS